MSSEQIPPVVEALVKYFSARGRDWTVDDLRKYSKAVAAILAAHQPPDGLKELLAAAREYERVARFRPQIVQCLDGSGVLVCSAKTAWSEKSLANWGCDADPAAAIRAATEKLRPKAEPCQLCAGRRALLCDACGGAVPCPRCSTTTPNP